jgi:capsular exopolysaccharide synthesis family protein
MLGDFDIDDILRTQGLDNLSIVTAGTSPPNPSEILRSSRFHAFLKEVYDKYNFIFIDTPPILPVSDATEVAPMVDGIILVYKVGHIGRGVLKRAKSALDNVNANVLGIILNNVKPDVGPDYLKYQTHYYYGAQEESGLQKTNDRPKFKRIFEKLSSIIHHGNRINILAAVLAFGLLIIGIFWQKIF